MFARDCIYVFCCYIIQLIQAGVFFILFVSDKVDLIFVVGGMVAVWGDTHHGHGLCGVSVTVDGAEM